VPLSWTDANGAPTSVAEPPTVRLGNGGLLPHPVDRLNRGSVRSSLVERTVPRTTPLARPAALAFTNEPGWCEPPRVALQSNPSRGYSKKTLSALREL
jgi:hypothetical protein